MQTTNLPLPTPLFTDTDLEYLPPSTFVFAEEFLPNINLFGDYVYETTQGDRTICADQFEKLRMIIGYLMDTYGATIEKTDPNLLMIPILSGLSGLLSDVPLAITWGRDHGPFSSEIYNRAIQFVTNTLNCRMFPQADRFRGSPQMMKVERTDGITTFFPFSNGLQIEQHRQVGDGNELVVWQLYGTWTIGKGEITADDDGIIARTIEWVQINRDTGKLIVY